MKRNKIIYDRWLRVLFLSFALLVGGGGWMAWGQTEKPIISLRWDEDKHNNVHTQEKIIYVDPNKPRVLSIPELNINTRNPNDNSYNWFVHWYIKNSNNTTGKIEHKSIIVNNNEAQARGGAIGKDTPGIISIIIDGKSVNQYTTQDFFVKVEETNGLIWSNRLKNQNVAPLIGERRGLGIDASTITYSNYTNGDTVYCDVSVYQDGELTTNSNKTPIYQEPTLLKRYKYVIKNATECPSYLGDTIIYKIDFPKKTTAINLSMPYTPDNYFWYHESLHQGEKFEYSINGSTFQPFKLITKIATLNLQQNQKINIHDLHTDQDNTIEVRAICSVHPGETSSVLAKFILHPIDNAEFKLESTFTDEDKKGDRWPRSNPKKYRQIGIVDFDQKEEGQELPTEITIQNNMSDKPLGSFNQSQTSYGFIYKNGKSLLSENKCYNTYPGMYGLFRSANHTGVSVKDNSCSDVPEAKRFYKWIAPHMEDAYGYATKIYKDKPLYDRTYSVTQETGSPRYGYFYYIDATDEPGTLVSVPIEGTICGNTELTVTGWLADMTRPGCDVWTPGCPLPLAPNLNIILKGVKDQEEIILHQFTTGDASTNYQYNKITTQGNTPTDAENKNKFNMNLMQWQQFHYKLIIPEDKIQGCTEFYLEVQNNEPHTDGADYAIDDIRIFKTIPDIQVVQSGNPCDEKIKTVKFKSNYNMLLSNFGLTANTEISENEDPLTYAEFENLPEDHLLKKYLNSKYSTKEDIESALKYFTTIYYAIYEVSNEIDAEGRPIPQNKPITIKYGNQESTYRTSYLSTRLEDMAWTTWSEESSSGGTFKADDGYITSANVSINGELTANKTYIARVSETPIEGGDLECKTCSFYNSFTLEGVGDRIIVTKDNQSVDIENVKPGEPYHVTGTLKYNLPGSDELRPIENPIFDWYLGTWDEFVKPGTITVGAESYSIMEAFKAAFHDLNNTDASTIEQELKTQLGEYTKDKTNGKLILNTKSFDFSLPTGKNMQWGIMLPRANQNDIPTNAVICPDPHEFLLGGTPPTIDPGDPDVPDPEDPDPEDPEDPDPKDPEDPDTPQPDENPFDGSHVRSVRVGLVQIQDMHSNNGTLRIPIHARTSLENEKFVMTNDRNILVYKTSDTNWDKTIVIGTLYNLVDNEEKNVEWRKNYFQIQFNEKAVKNFKEGFWYMVGIPYKVVGRTDNSAKPYGDRVFMLTLKIVPEYVTWVGKETDMHNWNNDGSNHWRRSNDAELYMPDASGKSAEANGKHPEAYTPMRFTKVTIAGNNGTAYAAYPHLYKLSQRATGPKALLDMAPANMDKTIGAATKNIEYDLLADPDYEKVLFKSGNEFTNPDKSQGHSYACVRFYGNTCNEIYIKPESEILHTEYLTYNTAHVDYEMTPNRWYMLASPLKGVVSGDMYLPTGSGVGKYARQETPAFGEINYEDNTKYTRWNPAVYMRGWDKTTATVVRPDGSTKVNYGIKSSWSNLYNDVDVPFTPGTGFSIGTKADVATLDGGKKVLFRLPKADNEYTYYSSTNGSGDKTTLTHRTGNGRFYISPDDKGQNTVTSCPISSTGGMFGNPFMSHLDMAKFLNGKSTNTYYIMTATGTTAHILGDEYSISTGDVDPKYVAPLQSFIVKDLTSATFTTDMIAKAPATGKPGLRSATSSPADEPLPQLRITATRDGVRNTAVVAGLVTASDSYVEGEDAALLINEDVAAPQVYTLAGNQMTAINVTPELNKIPVGIHSKDATPVELSFKVSGAMQNVTLVDKQAGKSYPVTDNLTLTVPGNTSGRYFLNGSIVTSNEIVAQNRIIFYSSTNGRIDISSTDPLTKITVYDISGRQIRVLNHINAPVAAIEYLRPGIYLVQAESITQTVTEKVDVK